MFRVRAALIVFLTGIALTGAAITAGRLRVGADVLAYASASDIWIHDIARGLAYNLTGDEDRIIDNSPSWSPDGSRLAFTIATETGLTLWTADPSTGRAARVGNVLLNGTHPRRPFDWLSDSRTLIARTVPGNRPAAPTATAVPAGPLVQENLGRRTPSRTTFDRAPEDDPDPGPGDVEVLLL
mgnify:CR=1 FL=1